MNHWPIALILFAGMFLSVWFRKLTLPGAIVGGLAGLFIYAGAGFTGIGMIAGFFVIATLATSYRLDYKKENALAESVDGKRNAAQVAANAGVAAILGLLIYMLPAHAHMLLLMMAASISAATADTLSSELGNIFGRRYYRILGFKKGKQGDNGVVSAEGTLAGIGGSLFIALIFAIGHGADMRIMVIVAAGAFGNIVDSILGASLENAGHLGNNSVNFYTTLSAALAVLGFYNL